MFNTVSGVLTDCDELVWVWTALATSLAVVHPTQSLVELLLLVVHPLEEVGELWLSVIHPVQSAVELLPSDHPFNLQVVEVFLSITLFLLSLWGN